MKKKIGFVFSLVLLFLLSACRADSPQPPYLPQPGAYGFQTAVVTNLVTGERQEKTVDELLLDESSEEWAFLLNFSLGIREDTEFIRAKDGRWVTLNEGFAFEIAAENTLKTRLSHWRVYDGIYDVVILLKPTPRYC